ncbi:MAG: hypothetical protein RSB05_03260 [Clostridiales bacterium]
MAITWEFLSLLIAIVFTVIGAAVAYAAFSRRKNEDICNAGKEQGEILTKLGYLQSSMDTILKKLEKQDEQYSKVAERLSAAEASAKSAHKRIDKMEGKI